MFYGHSIVGHVYRIPSEKLVLCNWYRHCRVNVMSGFGAENKNLFSCLCSGELIRYFMSLQLEEPVSELASLIA